MASVVCSKIDLFVEQDAADLVRLLREYALDPMGGSEDLPSHVQTNLISELQKRSSIVHAFVARVNGEAAGLAIGFEGFSTFNCSPLLNIHDFIVSSSHRRLGVGASLLNFIDDFSRRLGFCKLTLEVLQGNEPAMALYRHCGFAPYELDPKMGAAVFWQKKIE